MICDAVVPAEVARLLGRGPRRIGILRTRAAADAVAAPAVPTAESLKAEPLVFWQVSEEQRKEMEESLPSFDLTRR